jgi:hypothetical protein
MEIKVIKNSAGEMTGAINRHSIVTGRSPRLGDRRGQTAASLSTESGRM